MTGTRKRVLSNCRNKLRKPNTRNQKSRCLIKGGTLTDVPEGFIENPLKWINDNVNNETDIGLLYKNTKEWLKVDIIVDEDDNIDELSEGDKIKREKQNLDKKNLQNALNDIKKKAKTILEDIYEKNGEEAAKNYVLKVQNSSMQLHEFLQQQLITIIMLAAISDDDDEDDDDDEEEDKKEENQEYCFDTTGNEKQVNKLLTEKKTDIFIKADGGSFCINVEMLKPLIVQNKLVRLCETYQNRYSIPEYKETETATENLENVYVNSNLFGVTLGVMFPLYELIGYVLSLWTADLSVKERSFKIERNKSENAKHVTGYLAAANYRSNDPLVSEAMAAVQQLRNVVFGWEELTEIDLLTTDMEKEFIDSLSLVSAQHCEEQDKLYIGSLQPTDPDLVLSKEELIEKSTQIMNDYLRIRPLPNTPTYDDIHKRNNIIVDIARTLSDMNEQNSEQTIEWAADYFDYDSTLSVQDKADRIMDMVGQQKLSSDILSDMFDKVQKIYLDSNKNINNFNEQMKEYKPYYNQDDKFDVLDAVDQIYYQMNETEKIMIDNEGFDNEDAANKFWVDLNDITNYDGVRIIASEEPLLRKFAIYKWTELRYAEYETLYNTSLYDAVNEALNKMTEPEKKIIDDLAATSEGLASSEILTQLVNKILSYNNNMIKYKEYIDNKGENLINLNITRVWNELRDLKKIDEEEALVDAPPGGFDYSFDAPPGGYSYDYERVLGDENIIIIRDTVNRVFNDMTDIERKKIYDGEDDARKELWDRLIGITSLDLPGVREERTFRHAAIDEWNKLREFETIYTNSLYAAINESLIKMTNEDILNVNENGILNNSMIIQLIEEKLFENTDNMEYTNFINRKNPDSQNLKITHIWILLSSLFAGIQIRIDRLSENDKNVIDEEGEDSYKLQTIGSDIVGNTLFRNRNNEKYTKFIDITNNLEKIYYDIWKELRELEKSKLIVKNTVQEFYTVMDETEKKMIDDNGFDNEDVKVMFWDELNTITSEQGLQVSSSDEPLRSIAIDEWKKLRAKELLLKIIRQVIENIYNEMNESEKNNIDENGLINGPQTIWINIDNEITTFNPIYKSYIDNSDLIPLMEQEWKKLRENSVEPNVAPSGLIRGLYKGSIRDGVREALNEMTEDEIARVNGLGINSSLIISDIINTRLYNNSNSIEYQDYINTISEEQLNLDIQNIWDEMRINASRNSGGGISNKQRNKQRKKANTKKRIIKKSTKRNKYIQKQPKKKKTKKKKTKKKKTKKKKTKKK